MTDPNLARREAIRRMSAMAAGLLLPLPASACRESPRLEETASTVQPGTERPIELVEDEARFHSWVRILNSEGYGARTMPLGQAAARVGGLAVGTPYEAFTLEEYIRVGGSPVRSEPLTLSLTRFDCVSLVESCLAIARVARSDAPPTWEEFATQMDRMRYRDGVREGYGSRLHYFSDWLHDNDRRGLVRLLGRELGGVPDRRPLRFMSSNAEAYPAMEYPEVREEIAAMERSLDGLDRWVVPTANIPAISDRLETGDILAFATSIAGLDVTHAAFAYRDEAGIMRVLHAPLSGGVVEVTGSTLPQYVAAIRQSTGILVARPLDG